MSNFNAFLAKFTSNVQRLLGLASALHQVDVDGDLLWATYLSSFPEGSNPLFRERTEHDCNSCRHFIRRWGNLVAVVPGDRPVRDSIWNFDAGQPEYQAVVDALHALVVQAPIKDVLVSGVQFLGGNISRCVSKTTGEVETWRHLHVELPKAMVIRGADSEDTVRGRLRTNAECMLRALRELDLSAVRAVSELVGQGTVYRGEQWAAQLELLALLIERFEQGGRQADFAWAEALAHPGLAGIRNTSIGALLVDLSGGMSMDDALARYEKITAPSNYRRPKPVYSESMLAAARKTIEELGLGNSLQRRHARLEDVSVADVLFADRDSARRMKGSALDDMAASLKARPPRDLDRVEEISWGTFVEKVLPTATSLEICPEARHAGSLVSLLAPVDPSAPPLFGWDNGFSWAYAGNVADSMKERVKALGGRVDGVLRFTLQWNEDGQDHNDLDAHCRMPNGTSIYYGNKRPGNAAGGTLDVDIMHPNNDPAIENIAWPRIEAMPNGDYRMLVHCFRNRGGAGGFRAEVEFDGTVHPFAYDMPMRQDQVVEVATVRRMDGKFSLRPGVEVKAGPGAGATKWGVELGRFVPVKAVMFSPNRWGGAGDGVGHRHLFMVVEGCLSDEQPNGFYNEFLRPELHPHRKVLEALGGRMKVEPSPDQLSGFGFSTSKRDSVLCRVSGHANRIVRVAF
jgi:hypothetical protein